VLRSRLSREIPDAGGRLSYADPALHADGALPGLVLTPQQARDCYRDRWLAEHLPLAAKQMLGANRQFVRAPETCRRLPELALLAGAVFPTLPRPPPPSPPASGTAAPSRPPIGSVACSPAPLFRRISPCPRDPVQKPARRCISPRASSANDGGKPTRAPTRTPRGGRLNQRRLEFALFYISDVCRGDSHRSSRARWTRNPAHRSL